ncbi:hypothetical protein C8R46DRAFT_1188516 [Mycena filopes]|nr:hypothetical protein C8R46DRAFT_1188516 [Mycena filopes]
MGIPLEFSANFLLPLPVHTGQTSSPRPNQPPTNSHFKFLDSLEESLYYRYGFQPQVGAAVSTSGELTEVVVGELLGDPQWIQNLAGDAASGRGIKNVPRFLEALTKAEKLDDVPPEIYELRQPGAAPLRPSPIELRWEAIDHWTYYFLSPKARSPAGMQESVVLRSAAAAIEALRRNSATIEEVALNLVARGIPFNTSSPGQFPPPPPVEDARPPYKGLGFRNKGFRGTPSEYAQYESARTEILCSERGRVALMSGGIIARLAVGVVSPQVVCSGRAKGAAEGHPSPPYWDDALTQQELDILCGVYEVSTGQPQPSAPDGVQIRTVSWWPRAGIWRKSGLDMGYWTPSCEAWFQNRLAEIQAGSAELHNTREWTQILGGSDLCGILFRTNDRLAAAFLKENGTRIAARPATEQFPKAIGAGDSSSQRFYLSLRTHRPDSPIASVVEEPAKSASEFGSNAKQPLTAEAQQLTRQYWEARRKITTSAQRGAAIEKRLRSLKVKDSDIHLTPAELGRRLRSAESELVEERKRSRKAQAVARDIQRECKTPDVVPKLLAALGEN